MKRILLALSLAASSSANAAVAAAGDILITGFNSDGNDDLAFVLLAEYAANQVIRFSDNEWDGVSAWADTNETFFNWSNPTDLPVGTVISLSSISSGTIATNFGTATLTGGSNPGLANSNESVYVYLGSSDSSPTAFITAFGNSGFSNVSQGFLTNTGLTAGTNAITFAAGEDIIAYKGPRDTEATFSAYASFLTNTSSTYWDSQNASGDQSIDATAPDVPFNTTAFTVIPEPSSTLMVLLAGLLIRSRMRRR